MIVNYLPRKLRNKISIHSPLQWFVNITFFFLIIFFIHFIVLKFAESIGWMDSFWLTWQTFTTVGYGDLPAKTFLGRIFTILFSTLGIAVMGAVFAAAFDVREYKRNRRKMGQMKNPIKDGYVIFNFPGVNSFMSFVNEIRVVEKEVGICVVDSRLECLPESLSMVNGIHFIRGKTLDKNTYIQANLKDNKAIIVFPTDPSVSESDGATKIIVELITKFVEKETRIIHILVDPDNSWMFENTISTSILENIEVMSIVQECQDQYSSVIVEKLFLNTEGANPNTVKPELIAGWKWGEFCIGCVKTAEKLKVNCNPFALIHDGGTDSCPAPETVINKEDHISVIVFPGFDWVNFEKELAK
ncbi:two pore domain potassium channel family protein [bacterium]|nr:two pore domain potassium channel family protein [bacterium]